MAESPLGRLAACVLSCILAAACASPAPMAEDDGPGVEIAGIVIRNDLAYVVSDVMVRVPSSGRFAGCGAIFPRTECKTSFPAIDYRNNALLVTWSERGEPQATDEFVVELPPGAQAGDRLWLEVIVYGPGLAGARLAPH